MLVGSPPACAGGACRNTWHTLHLLIRPDYPPIHTVPLPRSDLEWSAALITIVCQHLRLPASSPHLTPCTSWMRAARHRGWPGPQGPKSCDGPQGPETPGSFGNRTMTNITKVHGAACNCFQTWLLLQKSTSNPCVGQREITGVLPRTGAGLEVTDSRSN